MQDFRTHVLEAIRIKGSQQKLAEAVGCSQQHISYLLKEADRVSAEIALGIDRATDGRVPRHQLRPDLYPKPEQPSEAAA